MVDFSVIDKMVVDRTQEDVNIANELKRKYELGEATAFEKNTLIFGNLKGVYSISDLNRVESCVKLLADMLVDMPEELKEYAESKNVAWNSLFDVSYDVDVYKGIVTKTDWDYTGQLFGSDIAPSVIEDEMRYLGNVQKLKDSFDYETEELPKSLNRLTFYGANAIESCLKRLYNEIEKERLRIKKYIDSVTIGVFSGEYYSAEIPFCQEN